MKINYNKLINLNKKIYDKYSKKIKYLSLLRLFIFIVIILLLCNVKNNIFLFLLIIFILIFIFVILVHDRYYIKQDYYSRYLNILNEYKLRIEGRWNTFLCNGIEYLNKDNIYLDDLSVIGNNSLYQYLCIAKTKYGRDLLYRSLDNLELSNKELRDRQKSIYEISSNINFVMDFQVYLSRLDDNFNKDNIFNNNNSFKYRFLFIPLFIIGNLLSIIIFILGIFNVISINYFYLVVIFKYLISYLYGLIYKNELSNINNLSYNASKLLDIFKCISNYNFTYDRLVYIKKNITNSIKIIKEIDSINTFSKLKDNFVANFIFNGIFTIDPYILYKYNKINSKDLKLLDKAFNSLEELECLVSLCNINLTKDNICVPNIDDNTILEFNDIHHPLLNEDKCITNSFIKKNNINIITGSNMSGKTSFLRTIGINIVLCNAGGYVCAKEFNSSNYKIFTSISVKDDLLNGESTFYRELLRIKEAIDYIDKSKKMIVLVDEIFKGTNYNDRIFGASMVIERLSKKNILLFITTHDIELCNIKNISNYHFREYYKNNNIEFDYKIKEGICNSSNAKYLMKKLNIIEEKNLDV